MQFKRKLVFIVSCCILLLSGVTLLIGVRAQVPGKAQIVFSSDRDGNWEIYIMDADGSNQRNLTNHSNNDLRPDWFDPAYAYGVSPAGKLKWTWGWVKKNSE